MAEVQRLLEAVGLFTGEALPWPRESGKLSLSREMGTRGVLVLGINHQGAENPLVWEVSPNISVLVYF